MNNLSIRTNRSHVLDEKMVIMIAGIGMFLSTLDTGIMNVALPFLEQEFNTTVTMITWTVTGYLMSLSGTIVILGRAGDRYGRLKLTTFGFIFFMLSSVLCGFSQEVWQLILFRTFQGVGAAMLQAASAALITTLVPPEKRGNALGTLAVMIGLGPILGPTAGGLLISLGGWRWIFWINIPLCLLGLWGCYKLLKIAKEERENIQLDILGNVLFSLAVLSFIWGVSKWPIKGMTDAMTYIPLIASICLVVLFIWKERRTKEPIIPFAALRKPFFTVPILATIGFGTASAIIFIVPPYFLQEVIHLTPWQIGLVTLSAPLGLVILSRLSGNVIGRFGTTKLMTCGLVIMILSFAGLSLIRAGWSIFLLAVLLLLFGVGGGIFQPSNISAVMSAVTKEQQGTIGSVQRMVQNVAIALGTSIAAALMRSHAHSGKDGLIQSFQQSWIVAGSLLFINLFIFLFFYHQLTLKK